MAGLVVIDFIDMEYGSNVRKVEKAMKDALKDDRARIQVGRISGFGLMEMSRQRLRTGVLEATTRSCPHCDGSGLVRTAGSAGLSALRLIEEEAAKGRGIVVTLFASQEAAVYVLNAKRADLAEIERRYGVAVEVIPEGENEGAKMRVASSGPRNEFVPKFEPVAYLEEPDDDLPEEEDEVEEAFDDDRDAREPQREQTRDSSGERVAEVRSDHADDGDGRRKRRKRRRGRGRDQTDEPAGADESGGAADGAEAESAEPGDHGNTDAGEGPQGETEAQAKRRRRGRRRRGGRNREEPGGEAAGADHGESGVAGDEHHGGDGPPVPDSDGGDPADDALPVSASVEPVVDDAPAPKKRASRKKVAAAADTAEAIGGSADGPALDAKPKRAARKKAADEDTATVVPTDAPAKRSRRKKSDPALAEPAAQSGTPDDNAAPVVPRPRCRHGGRRCPVARPSAGRR